MQKQKQIIESRLEYILKSNNDQIAAISHRQVTFCVYLHGKEYIHDDKYNH